MKTQHTIADVAQFLAKHEQATPESVFPLSEGHVSQAFSYETPDEKFVCRLAKSDKDFLADRFAYTHFSNSLPIPKVKAIGEYNTDTYYCISAYVEGKTALVLQDEEMTNALPEIHHVLSTIYLTDIAYSCGYGQINTATGNAGHDTWRQKLDKIHDHGSTAFKKSAANVDLDTSLVDQFFAQYESNIEFASETRRLFHGDPGFDNMLVKNGKVTAIIDWGQMGYGDWMCDFARLDFWKPGRYGSASSFAAQYGLEAEDLEARKALYWATNALWAIEFADRARSESVTQWLHDNLRSKLVQ